jgi:hypothetical protein
MKSENQEVCQELFKNFSTGLLQKEPIEQAAIVVGLTQEAAEKSEQLTSVFCNALVGIYGQDPALSLIMQEIMSPVIRPLREHKQTSALEKILCIFADNTNSHAYQQINDAIQNKVRNNNLPTMNTDNDAALAKMLQEGQAPDDNFVPGDNDFDQAIAASLAETSNQPAHKDDEELGFVCALSASEYTNPSAPTQEVLEELDEEAAVKIAIEESLATSTPNTNSNPSILNNLRNIFLGGYGS